MNNLNERLNIKSQNFYETNLPFKQNDREDYLKLITDKVAPLINELEKENTITGFHFIMHDKLDLRLSIENEKIKEKVKNILEKHSLPNELKEWTMEKAPIELYGGKIGVELCYEVLEFYSKEIIKILQYRKIVETEFEEHLRQKTLQGLDRLTQQFIHYLYVQQGINNIQQVGLSLQDAHSWIETVAQNMKSFLNSIPPIEKQRLEQLIGESKRKTIEAWEQFSSIFRNPAKKE